MNTEYKNRKEHRIKRYDYSSAGAYYITVCTKERKKLFLNHMIRDRKDYEFHVRYIHENPLKWYFNGENHDDMILYE